MEEPGQIPKQKPPEITFRISPKALLAMRELQHTDESRFVLCGVHFEIHPDGKVLLITTNGRYLAILKADTIVGGTLKELIEFTVDYPFVRFLPKPLGSEFDKILVHYDGAKVHFHSQDQLISHDVIKGDFPKWRQVLPTTPFAAFEVSINPEYLHVFMKASKLLCGKDYQQIVIKGHQRSATKEHDEYSPYSIFMPTATRNGHEFYGVIMPMSQPELEIPKWLDLVEVKAPVPKETFPTPIVPESEIEKMKAGTDTAHVTPAVAQADAQSEASERCAQHEHRYGKTFVGTSENGFQPEAKPGHSIWIEWGKWYTAPTVDSTKFGHHAYGEGTGSCRCGCHMGDSTSSGPVDPFGACPENPIPEDLQKGLEPLPPVPHPIIPPHPTVTKAQARKERKRHVHKHHSRPRKNLDRSRRNRHRKAR